MDKSFFEKKPPKHYEENFIKYINGLDTMPEYIHFILHGYSQWETERMLALIWIESFKYHFDDLVEQYNPSKAEIAQYKAHIDELIKAYNEEGDRSCEETESV